MAQRISEKLRKTSETEISVKLNIDGTEVRKIKTGIGLLDHMLDLFAYWGHFDLEAIVNWGDFNIDIHHTNEDVGIVLGQAFKEALGDKQGINRIGSASVPMEEVTATVTVDISGRSFFKGIQVQATHLLDPAKISETEGYSLEYANHFFESFAKNMGLNLIIELKGGNRDLHTNLEPVFKALGIALDQATQIDPRRKGIPSTKGVID
ncbi:MAG: imidazoleglycerol-phosphate dehydratase [Candidatus Omnitrophica bacterium]|nr:imidazoleglycerol-phosphate dehydratase [Candidatus Omnitrophota bacterium]MBU4303728.1 imidazoleglycerol-phosphate dehydratase [Candidatus Omnitrophota bacterium]MBU4419268.1 imidazoleglycerol-phosphate dehydratase [Candidatus Omnitrophota bacterium]MBU4468501.1 imidazoleglycerol-phosphate dehydratase [Candidatus Omnitrophota bacterium]MCG2707676.1 imidazoleglycerol-phosphate dehydratase [Candidatus Omnitrophota bacterium]